MYFFVLSLFYDSFSSHLVYLTQNGWLVEKFYVGRFVREAVLDSLKLLL